MFKKSSVSWDVTLCNPLKVNQCFEQSRCLYLQGPRITQARNQYESLSNQSLIFSALHGVMSQKVSLRNHRRENLKSCLVCLIVLCSLPLLICRGYTADSVVFAVSESFEDEK
jgi:hypothetical protein